MSIKTKIELDFQNSNKIKIIKNAIASVVYHYMRNDEELVLEVLPAVKDIFLDLIDDVWKTGIKMFDLKKEPEKSTSPNLRNKIYTKDGVNLHNSNYFKANFGDWGKELNYSRGHVFNKSIRELDKKVDISPGPACYDNSKKHMNTSSGVVFPKVTKRYSYIPSSVTPGPGKYNSILRKLSNSKQSSS